MNIFKSSNLLAIVVAIVVAVVAVSYFQSPKDSKLIVFDWGGYEDPAFFKAYIEKYGESPEYSFFSDEEEAFQKVRAGFKADIGHPCSQSVVKWRNAGIIEPIDTSRLKNWSKVTPNFAQMEGFQVDGVQWAIPLDWGSSALTYHTEALSVEEASTLMTFTNPKFKGKVSLVDNVDDAYALGFLAVGVKDWTKATDSDFKKASAFLRQVHQNVRTYHADGAEGAALMKSGEIVLEWTWNEVAHTLGFWEELPIVMNRNTKEGSSTWVCGYTIMKDGPGSKQQVYDFLDAWLDDSSAEYMVTEWGYGHTNGDVMKAIGKENNFDTLESYTVGTLFQKPASPSLREKMIKEFELIKAGL
jgi:spermidine/putrescine-binding protein